jgi:uncharacterized protein (DUF1800 family)
VADSEQRSVIAHLLRRTGFGPTATEVDAAMGVGYDATVAGLLDFGASDPADAIPVPPLATAPPARNLTTAQRQAAVRQRQADVVALTGWWLRRMAVTAHPLREKLTWFWHGHFATSVQKVQRVDLMAAQNALFRSMAAGNFEALTHAVAKDPAMMIWLDTITDVATHPNENFARECMELFTLGIGNYTEGDVKEAARAFTGWKFIPRTGAFVLVKRQHDNGVKTVLGQTGSWGGDDVVRILTNSAASARFVTSRLWSHLAYPVPMADAVVSDLAPGYAADRDIGRLVRSILLHPAFTSSSARTGLVKQPLEWLMGAVRALGLPAGDTRLVAALRALGQQPFAPPNVGGWPQNEYWLTTASMLTRLRVATTLVTGAPESAIASVAGAAVGDRVDAAAHLVSVPAWSATTAAALARAASDPRHLVTLALVSPEYTLA